MQEILTPRFETIAVESGEAAIDVVRHSPVHLILTDEHMPALGGVETVPDRAVDACGHAVHPDHRPTSPRICGVARS